MVIHLPKPELVKLFYADIRHFVERHFVYCAISSKRLFVEVSFCRMSTSSKQIFVEYFRRNILCSPGRHIVSADPVTVSCDCEATDKGEDY